MCGCHTYGPSPTDLADLEAAAPNASAFGSGIPIPEGLSMAGLYEVIGKMSHSCNPSCNCEAPSNISRAPLALHHPNWLAVSLL